MAIFMPELNIFGNIPTTKMVKNGQKKSFWTLKENLVISFVCKWYKIKVLMVHEHSAKIACLAKIKNSFGKSDFSIFLIINNS